MFFIPWRTDAPIYHFPFATIGLIVVNTLIHFIPIEESEEAYKVYESWMLSHGDGLHPLQWISSNFMHGSFLHLLGNMVILWGFGIVVEGKIGWWRFLLVYLGIGAAQCALEQGIALGGEYGVSLGASAVIFGLMGIALVWAPKNELHFVGLIGLYPVAFDITILTYSVWSAIFETLMAFLQGTVLTSSGLHMMGGIIGFGVGTFMLKMKMVDCENWDLFAVATNTYGNNHPSKKGLRISSRKVRDDEGGMELRVEGKRSGRLLREVRQAIASGDYRQAHDLYFTAKSPLALKESELRSLIRGLQEAGQHLDSLPVMRDYVQLHPEKATRMRLKAAEVLIKHAQRPQQALRVLESIRERDLTDTLAAAHAQLQKQAARLQQQGVIEFETEAW